MVPGLEGITPAAAGKRGRRSHEDQSIPNPESWPPAPRMISASPVTAFWFLWGVDAQTTLIAVYFLFVGLAEGSVSSFNMGIWLALLLGLGGVAFGSLALRSAGREAWARALVIALALPTLGIGFFLAVLLVTHPRWN